MPLIVITVVLAIALVASLAFNMGFFGQRPAPQKSSGSADPTPRAAARDDDSASRAAKAEGELEKKRKELEELKKTHAEVKDELKAAKKKVFDQGQANKAGDDLVKARAEVERHASIQLDATRQELANALSDVQKLKGEIENKGKRRAEQQQQPKDDAKPEEKREQAPVQRVIRELSEAEKEKMQRLEQQSSSDKKKAIELAAELRNVKIRVDREKREARRVYEEGKLARDKFRAVEIRLNRTLLENDMIKRAIADIEKKTGVKAELHAPTAEQLAESDQKMKDKHAAEDRAADEARAKLEAAEAVQLDEAPATADAATATGPVTPAPETKSDAPAPTSTPTA